MPVKFICQVCGYVYDEREAAPFASLPESWKCPLCGASRGEFRPEEERAVPVGVPVPVLSETPPDQLTPGQAVLVRGEFDRRMVTQGVQGLNDSLAIGLFAH